MLSKIELKNQGMAMHALATRLFKIPRSITGQGFRDSLALLNESLKETENGGGI